MRFIPIPTKQELLDYREHKPGDYNYQREHRPEKAASEVAERHRQTERELVIRDRVELVLGNAKKAKSRKRRQR